MTEQPTTERHVGGGAEIGAFRYTAESDRRGLNPLNLNGLSMHNRRPLSDRILQGMRVWVRWRPAAEESETPATAPRATEGMGVFTYRLPVQDYRVRRRRQRSMGRRLAVAGTLLVLPLGWWLMHAHGPARPQAASHPAQPAAVQVAPVQPAAQTVAQPAAQTAAQHPAPPANAPVEPSLVTNVDYDVQQGDTLSEIAHRFHVPLRSLLAANHLERTHRLRSGEHLVLPEVVLGPLSPELVAKAMGKPEQAIVTPAPLKTANALAAHEAEGATPVAAAPRAETPREAAEVPRRTHRTTYLVQEGDTLSEIAHHFGLRSADLVEVNDLTRDTPLKIGRKILIPPTPRVDANGHRVEESDRSEKASDRPSHRDRHKLASRGLLGDLGRAIVKRFLWPTGGHISSGFGERGDHFHTGLDIPNHPGAPIEASKPGVVIAASWDGDYGKMVDISHGNGVVTRYAHCSKLLVHAGQRVKQGQVIALVGETGRATGPHLHYEVRINGRPVNPQKFF